MRSGRRDTFRRRRSRDDRAEVGHHVSAILQKLGVHSRREAANKLATLDATDPGRRAVSQIS